MTRRIVLITLVFTLSLFAYGLSEWFHTEKRKIASINQRHLREIEKLKTISKINEWLQRNMFPYFQNLPETSADIDRELVNFFDRYRQRFHFQVERFIYKDKSTNNLDIAYGFARSDPKIIREFLSLEPTRGFVDYVTFRMDAERITGTLKIIQPFIEDDGNVSDQ